MTVYLETIQFSVLVFPLIGLLLIVPVTLFHRGPFGELHEYRAVVFYLFAFATVTAMLLTVLPLPESTPDFCARRAGQVMPRLVPFAFIGEIADRAAERDMGFSPGDLVHNRAFWQILFNFIMLMPVGFFLRALYRPGLFVTVLIGFALSLLFEVTQLTGIWGLADCRYRVFDVDDLISNTAGVAVGWALLRLFTWLPDPRSAASDFWRKKR